ncbi:hypothetical protein B0H19DRAFT_1271459 [Mycena capillaripes]|nr:hypothetical protein B0H19DRAFT_1271459 [Mycena capillaripes]
MSMVDPPEMHRTLRIPEILVEIFSHLDPTLGADARELAFLAHTCIIFRNITLDALWIHQDDILNLIRLDSGYSGAPDPGRAERCQLIRALTHVQWLKIGILDATSFKHLGQIELLDTLHAILPASISFTGIAESTFFYGLRTMKFDVQGTELVPPITLVCTFNDTLLESFEVDLDSLQTLKMECYDLPDVSETFLHPGDSLRPLFCFDTLEVVSTRSPAGFDVNEATITDMARSWPYIKAPDAGGAMHRVL